MSRIWFLLTIVGISLLTASNTLAQLNIDPTTETGMKPYGTFEGGAIDSVSTTGGTLNLHIPLVSYPQRGGKLHLGFYVKLANGNYQYTPSTIPACTQAPRVCEYGTFDNESAVEIVPDFGLTAHVSGTIPPSSGAYASITASDGSLHEVGATSTGWRTNDATGFLCLNNCVTVLDRDGTRYSISTAAGGQSTKIEDANGNYITASQNANGAITGYTDTLNRSIPLPPTFGNLPGYTYSSDTSGCTGSLTSTKAYIWNLPGYQGGQMTFKLCFANVYYGAYNCIKNGGAPTCGVTLSSVSTMQSIVLPNGTAWTFTYDSGNPSNPGNGATGNLLQVTFPTGGYIKYAYSGIYLCQTPTSTTTTTYSYAVGSRTINSNDGTGDHTWTYSFHSVSGPGSGPGTIYTTSSTDPLAQKTIHTLTALGGSCSFYETQTQNYDSAGILVKTVNTDYHADPDSLPSSTHPITTASNVVPIRVTTSWPNGQVSKVETDYDTGVAMTGSQSGFTLLYGLPTAKREYDYGSGAAGALLRTTTTTYQSLSNSNYLSNNLLTLPSSVVTTDGAGTTKATTNYFYDQLSLVSSGITTQHDSVSPDGAYRGNATSVQRWVNLPTSSYLTTSTTFFDTGLPNVVTDPGTHATTFAYSSTFDGAYQTQVTNALNQSASKNYDFNTGLVTSVTDANNLVTSYSYDSMWRLAQVNRPDGGQDTITRQESTFPFSSTLTKKMNATQNILSKNVFDGFGRVTQSQITSDPQGTVYTDTVYDALGHVASTSNPYRTGTDPTTSSGTTTYSYDALNRKTKITYPDGSIVTTAYCGSSTLATDPTSKWRRSRTDGLGRLVEVDEPNSITATVASTGCPGTGEPIWVTSYGYDTLGNLISVLQNGSRARSFAFDSVSRMLSSTNPEAGTISYVYTADSTVQTKTDARSITSTYTYDAIHRNKTVTYSNGDPSISINYDEANCLGLTACQNIGQRTSMTDAAGSEAWSYQVDATNNRSVHVNQRTNTSTPSNLTKTSTYYLDLAGNLTSVIYPTGRTVNYTYDLAGRPATAADSANGITYATSPSTPLSGCLANAVCYTPQGSVYSMSIGTTSTFTGLNFSETFNSRLQPNEVKASSTGGNAMDITYNFVDPVSTKNAGHVYGITNNLDTTRSQSFTYDQLNRITSAQTSSTFATSPSHCWGETYTVDTWGNLQTIAATTNSAYTGCSQESGFTKTPDGNNHLSGLTYDTAGNTQTDGTFTYTWDGESQLKSAGGVNYTYDGQGRRVSKSNGKFYWYGSGGEILAETSATGSTTAEYIFFGGKRIAMLPTGGNAQFYVEDLLGSSRVVTTNTGAVCYDADFYPYGGERTVTNTCTQNVYKFEGKERDTETGNDDFGARYYSNRFGRWLSADWSNVPVPVPYANLINPQTLNLYAMVADDPESFADLDGHTQQSPANSSCSYENQQQCNNQQQQQTQAAEESAEAAGHDGVWGPTRDWLDVVEVSGSYGFGAAAEGQWGVAEGRVGAGVQVEVSTGVGGGNQEGEVFIGGRASGKAGPAEGEIKAGITASTKDGISASGEAKGNVGPAGAGVKVDKDGVHGSAGADKSKDSKLGGHIQLGLGAGVKINFSQAGRAWNSTVKAAKTAWSTVTEGISLPTFKLPPLFHMPFSNQQ